MTPRSILLGLTAIIILLAAVVMLRVRAEQITAFTGWAFYVTLALAIVVLVEVVLRAGKSSAATRANVRLLTGTTVVMLFAAEATLRYATDRWATYIERNGGAYVSMYVAKPTRLHNYLPGRPYRETKAEFTYSREINSKGFTGPEFPTTKDPNEFRIVAIGDSFTEGVGTSADTTWPKVVEARIGNQFPSRHVTSINVGIQGSDPYFSYEVLKEIVLPLHPDLVIQDINTSDINEIIVRGGMERFRPDGKVVFGMRPWWERLYGLSYITRAIIHSGLGYNFLLVKDRDMLARETQAANLIGAAVDSINKVCRDNGIALLVVSHPHQFEVEQEHYSDFRPYDDLMVHLEHEPGLHFVDLRRYYAEHDTITKATAPQYYWRLDLHHNTSGYRVMGESIAASVIQMGLGPESAVARAN